MTSSSQTKFGSIVVSTPSSSVVVRSLFVRHADQARQRNGGREGEQTLFLVRVLDDDREIDAQVEMCGNGWPGFEPRAESESEDTVLEMARRSFRCFFFRSSYRRIRMPVSASWTSRFRTSTWCSARGPGGGPSGSRPAVQPACDRRANARWLAVAIWVRKPETRIMKNSSRLPPKIERKRTRSSSGSRSSSASASTRR